MACGRAPVNARLAVTASAATLVLLATGCAGHAAKATDSGPRPARPAPVTAAAAITGARLARFEPVAASFVSPGSGWALGRIGCLSCTALARTADGGRRWRLLPAPPAPVTVGSAAGGGISGVAFADASNGFAYGPGLLATHNGGRSWTRLLLPPVSELVLAGGRAYAITITPRTLAARLWRTVIGSRRWTRLPLPPGLRPAQPDAGPGHLVLSAQAGTLALLQQGSARITSTARMTGRLWISTTKGTTWRARPVPCRAPGGGGATVMSIAVGHPDAWLLDCFDNEESSQEQNTRQVLFGSVNGGRSWLRLPGPPQHNLPELLADNGSGHAFLATLGAADSMAGTFDGGSRWQAVVFSGGSFSGWADLSFLDARTGYVVGPVSYPPSHLYRTDDGGRTWAAVRF